MARCIGKVAPTRFSRSQLGEQHDRRDKAVVHLFARAIRRAAGDEDNRNRWPHPNFSIQARFRLVYVAAEHRHFRNTERVVNRLAESFAKPQLLRPRDATDEHFVLRRVE